MAGKKGNLRLQLVVRDRWRIQVIALDLLNLLQDRQPDKPATDTRNAYDLLVGATFSLWRAVFLVELDNDWDTRLGNAESFLEKVIRDNAIGYADDWNNRRWSFAFYADNARYRLNEFSAQVPEFEARTRKFRDLEVLQHPVIGSNPFWHWSGLCEALAEAVEILRRKARGRTSPKGRPAARR